MTRLARTAQHIEDEDLEPLVDTTAKLTLKSKKLDRLRKKNEKKAAKYVRYKATETILDLPYELIIKILELITPSEVFRLSRTCKGLNDFIRNEECLIAKNIVKSRYVCLAKCFRLPIALERVDGALHPLLQSADRQEIISIHKKPYQHIKAPDATQLCTCLTCLLRWNSLCLAVDFAYWQSNLEKGEPIKTIQRGKFPEWNTKLNNANAAIVQKALLSPLWHALILQVHLDSMVRSIRRHKANKGNRRRRFNMSPEDAASGTDLFLERSGPPTSDIPFHRDNYYMLETFIPNRAWSSEDGCWKYMPDDRADETHENDLRWLVRLDEWRRKKELEKAVATAAHV